MSDSDSDLEDFTCRGITSFLNSANAKFAMSITRYLRVYRLVSAVRVRLGETSRCHRDSVSGVVGPTALSDTDDSRRTGKYYWYIGMRNVLLGVFCDARISRSYNVNGSLLTW